MTHLATGGKQHQSPPPRGQGGNEGLPRRMAGVTGLFNIVHSRAPDFTFIKDKAAGFDYIDRHAQAGGQPQKCSRVLWNVRLIEGKAEKIQSMSRL